MSRDGCCYRWQTNRPRASQCRSRRGGMGQPRENLETCFGARIRQERLTVREAWAVCITVLSALAGCSKGKQRRREETGNEA